MKTKRLVSNMLLILMMFASLTMVVPLSMASPTIHVFVDPASNVFYTNTTSVGDTFAVDVKLEDVVPADDLVGIEFKLYWDPTMLEGMSIVLPSGHIFQAAEDDTNLWITKKQLNKTGGYVHYIVTCSDLSQGYTGGYLPLGNGTAATITLKIIDKPDRFDYLECDLDLQGVKLSNGVAGSISHTDTDGEYQYIWTEPSTKPYLKVVPTNKVFIAAPYPPYTPEFDINIWIYNLDEEWHLVGVEFKLYYNTTLLNVTNVEFGDFLDPWAPYGYLKAKHTELDYVYILQVIWNFTGLTSWPNGEGILATITFQGIYAEEFPWIGYSDFGIGGSIPKLADDRGMPIPQNPAQNGTYTIYGYTLGRSIDLFTCSYPDDFNGKGPHMPADAFAPQDLVCLCALVTYNLDPVQNKLVSFEVHSPFDDHIIYLTGITNETGYACVSFRIPWPCPDWPEDEIFGIWHVVATADIANQLISDTMDFRVGWLVEITYVEPVNATYLKGEHMKFIIMFKTISAQYRNVTFTLVVKDELDVPIGKITIVDYLVGGAPLLGEKSYPDPGEQPFMVCLEVPKWAYIGTATIHVNAFTTFPSLGGYAYCPEYTDPLTDEPPTVRIIRP